MPTVIFGSLWPSDWYFLSRTCRWALTSCLPYRAYCCARSSCGRRILPRRTYITSRTPLDSDAIEFRSAVESIITAKAGYVLVVVFLLGKRNESMVRRVGKRGAILFDIQINPPCSGHGSWDSNRLRSPNINTAGKLRKVIIDRPGKTKNAVGHFILLLVVGWTCEPSSLSPPL